MNEKTLEKICAELESEIVGRKFGKIFPVSRFRFVSDFRLPDSKYLLISVEPSSPRLYLIRRRLRDLEAQSKNPSPFVLLLRNKLANAVLQKIEKLENERIVRFSFFAHNEFGAPNHFTLIIQLTGRSANLFLLDSQDFIIDCLRENSGAGQQISDKFSPPFRDNQANRHREEEIFQQDEFKSLSEALDTHFLDLEAEKSFQAKAKAAQDKIIQQIKRREKLEKKLRQDLANHGDAEVWKRYGDLILANLATAKRSDGKVFVTDFYDESTPTVEIEAEENSSLTEIAEGFFKKYTKARNALEEISKRLEIVRPEIESLKTQNERLKQAIQEKDENVLAEYAEEKPEGKPAKSKEKQTENFTGARRFVSSDDFEILVGKASKDNDFLTFRIAKSADLWLHAADYPGSHVIVKNPNRREIPQKTLIEAAQIAAFYSQAKAQAKVAVHYTQKKFVNKPKGSAAGLVSLASFKTILVEPKIDVKMEN